MRYLFGKDITRSFFPEENGAPIQLPTQTPTIYIFSTEPSRSNAATGTGKLGSAITTWTQSTASPYGCTYTIPAIADPSSTGTTNGAWYWEAINHVTKSSGTSQVTIRSFFLELTRGNEATPGTTVQDVIDNYPAITSYLTDDQISEFIDSAFFELRTDLEAKGAEIALTSQLQKTKLALAYKTISLASYSQFKEDNDKFIIRGNLFETKYRELMEKIVLPYDLDKDGQPETTVTPSSSYLIISR